MILSEKFGFIFIKTVKTAGTSIEVDLSRHVEEDAIVTPIIPPEPGHRPRNFVTAEGKFYNHMPAQLIRTMIGANRFNRLFKFCVEREPVAKCISQFHWLQMSPQHAGTERAASWDKYCEAGQFALDVNRYAERDADGLKLIVDRVLPYETLSKDLPALMRSLGIDDFRLTAQAKSYVSQDPLVRSENVSVDQRAAIYQAFRKGSELHGLYPLSAYLPAE